MDFLSAWIASPSALPFLCLIWGAGAQQAFRTEPGNLTVRMGAAAVLRCEVLRASGTVQWVKDGLLLGPQRGLPGFPRYSMIGNPKRGQYHLRIEDAQLEDDTSYECQAGQSESSRAIVSDTAWLNVQIPPSQPYLEVDVSTPWVAGRKYTVACVAPDAKPAAAITLYKDGVELTGAESSAASGSKDKLHSARAQATVTALSFDDGRQLTCRAENPALARPLLTALTMHVHFPPQPPVIEGPEEEVKAGRTLALKCVSRGGNPLANLRWTKNGDVLSTAWEEDAAAGASASSLYLKVEPSDNQAELSCQSGNLASTAPLTVSRIITVLFEPAAVKLLGSSEAVEGQDLHLSCSASSSNPPVHIRWWLGHRELNATSVAVEEGDHGGMRTVSNVTRRVSREDDGQKLACEAFNRGTSFSKTQETTLTVFYPPLNVWLDGPPQDVPLRSGTKVRLTCFSTGGNPTGTLTFFKNGRAVTDAFRQTSFDKGVARELVLVLTASDNMAFYRCDATNESKKTISAHIRLRVHFPAIDLKITGGDRELRRGQTLALECLSRSSNPKATISWSVGLLRFPGTERRTGKGPYDGVSALSELSLNLTSRHHGQKVICQARSPALDEASSTFYQLHVLYPPEFGPDQPTWIRATEDEEAAVPLLVSANPPEVSCRWLRRREELVRERHPRFFWSDASSLVIRNVTRTDAGVYTVECANEEGGEQTSITLDVQYAPDVRAEKDPVYAVVGETADLICVADANPVIEGMFSWTWLGEEEVEMGEETQEDESGLLAIHNVTRAHAGFYRCAADNGVGPAGVAGVKLVVQFAPTLRKDARWRKVASRGDGTAAAELACQAEGVPRVHVSWEKNGVPVDFANPRYEERTAREGSFHTSTVRVVNVSSALDFAVFTCTARNSLGEDKLDIRLVSTSRPDPPSSFRRAAVTHDSVTLEWLPGFDGGLRQRFRVRYIWSRSDSYRYADVFPPRATFFTVRGLQPLTTYNFSVNALNAVGESGYADEGAALSVTTEETPEPEDAAADVDSPGVAAWPAYLTAALSVAFGVLLVSNSLGCFFFSLKKKKKRRRRAGGGEGSVSDGEKNKEEGAGRSNDYQSREEINVAARRTLVVDSGSDDTGGDGYESYAAESSRHYRPAGSDAAPLGRHPEETRELAAAAAAQTHPRRGGDAT